MIKTQAGNFQLQQQRLLLVENITDEYLSILAILYGDQIQSGTKRVSEYGNMTMLEAENELRVRTLMMRGDRLRTKRKLKEEHDAAEKELMEQLKKSHRPATTE
jgi:hypothetical protein